MSTESDDLDSAIERGRERGRQYMFEFKQKTSDEQAEIVAMYIYNAVCLDPYDVPPVCFWDDLPDYAGADFTKMDKHRFISAAKMAMRFFS